MNKQSKQQTGGQNSSESFSWPKRRKAHLSWQITAIAAGILLGTAAVLFQNVSAGGLHWAFLSLPLIAVSVVRRSKVLIFFALLGGVFLGLYRGSAVQQDLALYQVFYGQQVTLQGKVSDDTTYGLRGDQRLRLKDVRINQTDLRGDIWVSTTSKADLKRGDVVTLKGSLDEGFGTMSASISKAELVHAERPHPGDVARRARDWFITGVNRAMPERQAALGTSYLVGQRRGLPESLDEQLRILGLTHLVVASGFHLTVVVRLIRRTIARASKYMSVVLSGGVIASFLLLTGFSTSMTRASLVAGLSLLAWYYGRAIHPVVLLLVVAAITVLIDPATIWGDVGWFLSFAAFAGVIILAPLLNHYFWGDKKEPGTVRQIVLATTAAQIMTLPIVAFAFEQYSPLALVSNLLILPLVPAAMLLTLLGGIVGVILPALAPLAGLPAYWVLAYMTSVTGWLSTSPHAQGEVNLSTSMLATSYVMILLLTAYLWRKTSHNFRKDTVI
jgi:competence protein ComEC